MNTCSRAKLGILAVFVALTACGGSGGSTNTGSSGVSSAINFIDWTWKGGSESMSQPGIYGSKGVAGPTYIPQALEGAVSWTDNSGNLWLFGGGGVETSFADFNDLWKFDGTNWAWMNGSNTANQLSVFGAAGVADPTYFPSARQYSATWADSAGNLWLFGGYVRTNASGNTAPSSDLWKYNTSTNQWAWMSGVIATSSSVPQSGSYGALGVASPSNSPGDRWSSSSWVDPLGNFWMFGGNGRDSAGTYSLLNDLWKFDGTNWTWMNGSDTVGQSGTYGTIKTPDAANVPGARMAAISWVEGNNLWLFGGVGIDASGNAGNLNDLWKFDGSNWTWMNGATTNGSSGNYGTAGSAAASNVPGARRYGVSWKDSSGNFWMFGGSGYDATGNNGGLNDLWKYDPVVGHWAWMSGTNATDQPGTYGTLGVSDPDNVPGARDIAVAWTNISGLWMFGGQGVEPTTGFAGYYNDFWHFQP